MIRPPPASSLFPYTTLFRSLLVRLRIDLAREAVPVALDAIEREAELRAAHRVHRHQRRMGEALVEILDDDARSEEHTSELQSRVDLVCRLLLEKKNEC